MNLRAALPAVVLAGLVQTLPAVAQTHSPVFPTRDVTVDYHIDGTLPLPVQDVRVQAQAGAERLRIEQPDRFVILVNRSLKQVQLVLTTQKIVFRLPWPNDVQQGLNLLARARFVRQGSDMQAGIPCTIYDVSAEGHRVLACITADGVLLRADGLIRSKSANGSYHLAATAVSYALLDPRVFNAPAGTHSLQFPTSGK